MKSAKNCAAACWDSKNKMASCALMSRLNKGRKHKLKGRTKSEVKPLNAVDIDIARFLRLSASFCPVYVFIRLRRALVHSLRISRAFHARINASERRP